jgi:hypothetical protein
MTEAMSADAVRRAHLRILFDTLAALDTHPKPTIMAQFVRGPVGAVERTTNILMKKFSADIAGECGGCGKVLLVGDQGHVCHDGDPILCVDCAYTWAEVWTQWKKGEHSGSPEDYTAFLTAYDKHLSRGGLPGDKMLMTLGG